MSDLVLDKMYGRTVPAEQRPGLPPEEIVRRIEKALALDGGTHTWEDLRERVVEGKARAFYDEHGCWIAEVIDSPQKRWLNAWIIAGQLPEAMSLHEQVEKYAEEQCCKFMKMQGRSGWKRVMPQYGWKQIGIVMMKEIGHGPV